MYDVIIIGAGASGADGGSSCCIKGSTCGTFRAQG